MKVTKDEASLVIGHAAALNGDAELTPDEYAAVMAEVRFDLIQSTMEEGPPAANRRARWHPRPASGLADDATGGKVRW